jgi:ubiquinone biosynthesis UbiH/UbiF/VisC/COQ6 family hydroxylase
VSAADFDVLVVGGGLPGLLVAAVVGAGCRRWRIGVLEAAPPAAVPATAPIGLRVFAIAPAVAAELAAVGAWQRLPGERVATYSAMQVWQAGTDPRGAASLRFDAAEAARDHLGAIVEHDLLRHALWSGVVALPSVTAVAGELAAAVPAGDGPGVTLTLGDGGTLRARLVIGADGGQSRLREALGVPGLTWSYGQQALVGHVRTAIPHGATAWQCFRPDGPVALLPLADGRASFVWSVAEARAATLAGLPPREFGAALTAATEGILGDLTPDSPRAVFPLVARHTRQYTGDRFALLGDAAHQVHPLAGQGVNLGLLDAACLGHRLVRHAAGSRWADPGERRVLRGFERERKGDNLATLATIEALHRLFAGGSATAARVAGLGLGLVDRAGPLKQFLAARAMGPASGAGA